MDPQESAKTIIPTMNRIDRVTKKALREQERKARLTARRPTGPSVAAAYEAMFEQLTRSHCVGYERLDWNEIATRGLVEPAMRRNELEQKARRKLANYQPGLFDALFGMGAERRRALAEKVLEAAKKDAEIFAQAKHNAEVHNLDVNLAGSIMALNLNAIETALKAHLPIKLLNQILEGFAVTMPTPGRMVIYIDGLELDAIPDESVDIGEEGKSVYRPLPPSLRYEMHLANICAATLRVGLEVMQVVPLDAVDILTRCMLPKASGDVSQYPVMHVNLPHHALKAMDMRRLEPVSTITALGGRIDWEAARGFAPIPIGDLKLTAPQPPQPAVARPAPAPTPVSEASTPPEPNPQPPRVAA